MNSVYTDHKVIKECYVHDFPLKYKFTDCGVDYIDDFSKGESVWSANFLFNKNIFDRSGNYFRNYKNSVCNIYKGKIKDMLVDCEISDI